MNYISQKEYRNLFDESNSLEEVHGIIQKFKKIYDPQELFLWKFHTRDCDKLYTEFGTYKEFVIYITLPNPFQFKDNRIYKNSLFLTHKEIVKIKDIDPKRNKKLNFLNEINKNDKIEDESLLKTIDQMKILKANIQILQQLDFIPISTISEDEIIHILKETYKINSKQIRFFHQDNKITSITFNLNDETIEYSPYFNNLDLQNICLDIKEFQKNLPQLIKKISFKAHLE